MTYVYSDNSGERWALAHWFPKIIDSTGRLTLAARQHRQSKSAGYFFPYACVNKVEQQRIQKDLSPSRRNNELVDMTPTIAHQ